MLSNLCKKFYLPDNDILIITHARNTLFLSYVEPWVKKDDDKDFDISMGCNDEAETSELVGTYFIR